MKTLFTVCWLVLVPLFACAGEGPAVPTENTYEGNQTVVVNSYEVNFENSNRHKMPGEYNIKVDVTNNGRRGSVKFKFKQTDFSGHETESITFSETFEADQQKTITTRARASKSGLQQTSSWIVEAYKY